ncbi:PAS domain-containing protein [Flavobacterium sp.]|uniref:PAS domain-containing protein n=1 Tax=Flavobacterium sp. TaxID=239 RepID=UPI003262E630
MLAEDSESNYPFLRNGGALAKSIKEFDWSVTSIGVLRSWPQNLTTTLGIMLNSKTPMFLVWGYDEIIFTNDSFGSMLTTTETNLETLGKSIDQVFNEDWAIVVKSIEDIIENDKTFSEELIILNQNKDFQSVSLNIVYCPILGLQGTTEGVLVTCTVIAPDNVIQQQKAEQNQIVISAMFEQSSVGIATISGEDLIFQSANTFYGELVGRTPAEIIGKPLLEAVPEIKGQGFDELLKDVINTGKPFIAKEVEVQLLRDDKLQDVYVDLTYQINRSASENETSVLVIATDVTQQVLSRRKVEESERRLQDLIAAAPAGIGLFVGRNLIIEHPNQTFIDIVGKGPDITGLPLREAMPELITEGQEYLKILDNIFTTGVPFISPASLVKIVQNGVLNDNYYNISYTPLRNQKGEIYAILDIAIDVTAQVLAQQALERSEAHLQLLSDTVPAMIFYLDENQKYRSYNTVFMDWFSVGKEDAIGKSVFEFLGEAAYEKTLPHLEIAYGGEQEKYEMYAPSRMGVDRWLSIVYTPHKNNEGKVIGIIVHATDITKGKKDEKALLDSIKKLELAEKSLLNAVEMAKLGTWTMDFATGITNMSQRHVEMFGMSGTNITSDEAISVIEQSDRDRVTVALTQAQQSGSDGKFDSEYKIINQKTQRQQIIHAVGQTYFDSKGKAVSISGTAQDITIQRELQLELENQVELRTKELAQALEKLQMFNNELNQTNEALLHSNQELAQFAYVASHDLQEPLRKIRIFTGMLAEGMPQLKQEEIIKKINKSAERMSQLIDDLLAFSRLTKPEKATDFVDIASVLQNVWVDFELAVQEKKAKIVIDKLPIVKAVGLQMNQLFYNLVSNSLKFTNPETEPKIAVNSTIVSHEYLAGYTTSPLLKVNYHHIIFSDNGIGFEKDYENRIFEIFKRLHTQNIYPGSGIGLALCKRIIVNHHGVLFAESEPGKGSTFHIFLPDIPLEI